MVDVSLRFITHQSPTRTNLRLGFRNRRRKLVFLSQVLTGRTGLPWWKEPPLRAFIEHLGPTLHDLTHATSALQRTPLQPISGINTAAWNNIEVSNTFELSRRATPSGNGASNGSTPPEPCTLGCIRLCQCLSLRRSGISLLHHRSKLGSQCCGLLVEPTMDRL